MSKAVKNWVAAGAANPMALEAMSESMEQAKKEIEEGLTKEIGPCSVCGKPTKSHVKDGRRYCHTCFTKDGE